jgi:hypothetical protein
LLLYYIVPTLCVLLHLLSRELWNMIRQIMELVWKWVGHPVALYIPTSRRGAKSSQSSECMSINRSNINYLFLPIYFHCISVEDSLCLNVCGNRFPRSQHSERFSQNLVWTLCHWMASQYPVISCNGVVGFTVLEAQEYQPSLADRIMRMVSLFCSYSN